MHVLVIFFQQIAGISYKILFLAPVNIGNVIISSKCFLTTFRRYFKTLR